MFTTHWREKNLLFHKKFAKFMEFFGGIFFKIANITRSQIFVTSADMNGVALYLPFGPCTRVTTHSIAYH